MPEPYNYLANLPNPAAQITGGLTTGMGLAHTAQQMSLAREQADMMAQYRAAQIEQEQAQTAKIRYDMQQQQAREKAVADLMANPNRTAADYEAVLAQLPKDRVDAMLAGFNAKTAEEQRADIRSGIEALAAVRFGDMQTYKDLIGKQITAAENAGDTTRVNALLQAAKLSPEQIEATIELQLAALGPQGQQALDNLAKVQSHRLARAEEPLKIQKLAGEALEAETKGKFAEKKIKGEIAKDAASASASYASAKKSLAEAKTEDEKRSAAVDLLVAQAALARSKIEKAMGNPEDARQGALATIDVIDKVLKNEADARSILGTWNAIPKSFSLKGLEGIKLGAWKPQVAMNEKELDVLANINELGGKTFLQQAQKMRGLGQLTEMEGKKIVEAAGNLSREQSPDRFMATLRTMREALAAGAARKPGSVPKGELIFGGPTQNGAQESATTGMSDEALMKALGL